MIKLRACTCNFWEFDFWSWQSLIQAQTIESLTNLQSQNSLSKCKVAMLKVRDQGGNDSKQRIFDDKPKKALSHWFEIYF